MSDDEHAQARARLRLAWGIAPEAAAAAPEAAPEPTDAQILSLARQDEALSTYERLRAESPFRAAHYLLENQRAIVAARQRADESTNNPTPPTAA